MIAASSMNRNLTISTIQPCHFIIKWQLLIMRPPLQNLQYTIGIIYLHRQNSDNKGRSFRCIRQ